MNFVRILLLGTVLVAVGSFSISSAYAWVPGDPIVPCGGEDATTAEDACEICDLAKGIDSIVEFFARLVAVVTVVIIVVAGIMYIVSAGNQGMVTMAKTAMKNALIGLIIVLTAFVLIHFVLRALAVVDTGNVGGVSTNVWTFTCN